MSDIFDKESARNLLAGKSVLLLGDSIMRNIYKDLVFMVHPDHKMGLTPNKHMIAKGEYSYLGDKLIEKPERMDAGRRYREGRDYYFEASDLQLSFFFLTRCYSNYVEDLVRDYRRNFGSYPDIILMNSCLWDINRYGSRGPDEFKYNLEKLFKLFHSRLDPMTQVVFLTTPPISVELRGGLVPRQLEFQQHGMRFNVVEANQYAANVVANFGYDVLDLHYHFVTQVHRRVTDGIHWYPDAVRMQSNLILTHLCLSRKLPLPGKNNDALLQEAIEIAQKTD